MLITSQTSLIWSFPVCCHVCAIKSTPSQLKDVRPGLQRKEEKWILENIHWFVHPWGKVSLVSCTFSFFVWTHVLLSQPSWQVCLSVNAVQLWHIFWCSYLANASQQSVGPGCCYSAQRASWARATEYFFYVFDVFPYTILIDEYL